jgi:protocatechuate 3,4-dioxygenase beta subunit
VTVIHGRVIDGQGKPVAQAAVYIVSAPAAMRDIAQLTNGDGRFAISVSVPGPYRFGARSDGGQTASAEVNVSGQTSVAVELQLQP